MMRVVDGKLLSNLVWPKMRRETIAHYNAITVIVQHVLI